MMNLYDPYDEGKDSTCPHHTRPKLAILMAIPKGEHKSEKKNSQWQKP